MRKVTLYLLICFIYLSCKKEIEEVVVVVPSSTVTNQLRIDQVVNDSTIVLKWSKYTGKNFQKYRLVRSATYQKKDRFESFGEPVDSSTDVNHLIFTESNMPLASGIYYTLYVSTDTTQFNQGLKPIGDVYYKRPNSLVSGFPTDALIDKQQKRLYLAVENVLVLVDYAGRIKASKEFPAGFGFCSLGTFNGNSELYVPVNDGWLQILDAATLQLKDKIYVAGDAIGSVVATNEKLYVSSTDLTQDAFYSNSIKVYDRATKNLVSRTGYNDRTRLVPLDGTSIEMVDLTLNLMPVDLSYYQFSPAGIPLAKKEDTYHGDYLMDARIVRSFPDGSKFITSSSGTIFNKSLVFDRYIKQHGNYSDFAFNNDGSIIYAAKAFEKKIDVVSYPATTTTSSYTTAFYPYKIFRDGNTLICVSRTFINQQFSYLLIEKIDL
jgi:hypothetical protein